MTKGRHTGRKYGLKHCRLKNIDKRRRRRCLDDGGNILCYSSECRQQMAAGRSWKNVIYPIRLCQQCQSANDDTNPQIWNRDINADVKMRWVAIVMGCDSG
ncbi:uncharacterized protein BYT42DRAFT_606292 [Radiomyces spectabilis]|uniref:uncharacterized protein n=1 Tax=Radiomyces spectabilis TaxID=64574 RepID=UPI0022206B15|nr:uncharacterized protein BYT42DRAFT_606292 [Radiomyces spectabilis]KAI8374363.1 hypothetical protein BYT42DRAFT_606292 [Radiomyces spectabilis]